jgi:hypothetical protein
MNYTLKEDINMFQNKVIFIKYFKLPRLYSVLKNQLSEIVIFFKSKNVNSFFFFLFFSSKKFYNNVKNQRKRNEK